MSEFMPQGYPLYAAVKNDDASGYVGVVVGWAPESAGGEFSPIVAVAEGIAAAVRGGVKYLGTDPRLARAAVGLAEPGAGTAHKAPGRAYVPEPGTRYAMHATALCGRQDRHERHSWVPPEHDYPIACPGELA